MTCPECGSDEIRAAECIELVYDIDETAEPADLVNSDEVFDPPGDYYFWCVECDHRWDRDGCALQGPSVIPQPL